MLSMGVMLQELSLKLFLKPWRLSFVRSPSCIEVVYSSSLSKYSSAVFSTFYMAYVEKIRRHHHWKSSLELVILPM